MSRESQRYASWHGWVAEPKPAANYLWSCYMRKINLCWIITIRVWFSVSLTKHISTLYRGRWRKLLPKWLDFTHIWELKTNSEDNLTRCLEPTGSAPVPVENSKELPNLITEGTKQPSSEASTLIVYLNLIHRQSQATKWSQWWMLPHQLLACYVFSPLIINSLRSQWRNGRSNRRAEKRWATSSLQEQFMGRRKQPSVGNSRPYFIYEKTDRMRL